MSALGEPVGGVRRIAALLAVALLLLGPAFWIGWSAWQSELAGEAIRGQSALLSGLRSRIADIEPRDPAAGESGGAANIFLAGETAALAGAALQTTVADAIKNAGGRVIETEFARVETAEEDPGRVDLRVAFDAEIVSLQQILLDLESRLPVLIVRSVEVQTAAEATEAQSPPLRVMMLVGGYLEEAAT